jgi:hypothetical protein
VNDGYSGDLSDEARHISSQLLTRSAKSEAVIQESLRRRLSTWAFKLDPSLRSSNPPRVSIEPANRIHLGWQTNSAKVRFFDPSALNWESTYQMVCETQSPQNKEPQQIQSTQRLAPSS